MNPRQLWQLLDARFGALSVRERGLVGAVALALVAGTWDVAVRAPLAREAGEQQAEHDALAAELRTEQRIQQQILSAWQADPEAGLRAQAAEVQARLDALHAELSDMTHRLIAPHRMTVLLSDVLAARPGLELVAVENVAAQAIGGVEGASGNPRLHRHGLRVEVRGSWNDVLAWVDAIEASPWSLIWRVLHYEVVEHPVARVRIEVETLSLDAEWIGA